MKTLSEFSKKYKPNEVNQYYAELNEQDKENYKTQLLTSYFNYVKKADGILSIEDFIILKQHGHILSVNYNSLPLIKGTGFRKIRRIMAILSVIILATTIVGVFLYVLGLVLYFVGGIAWTGFEIFADGSFLGFVFGVAAVIITLGMFVALIKAILR